MTIGALHTSPRALSLAAFVALVAACASRAPAQPFVLDGSTDAEASPGFTPTFGDAGVAIDASCATSASELKPQPVYLLFVLDASLSMNAGYKWDAAVAALSSLFDDLAATADPGIGVGLLVFSDDNDPTRGRGPYPSTRDLSIRRVDRAARDALRDRLASTTPRYGTPTRAALEGAYGAIDEFVPGADLAPSGQRVVVLMTDGVPNGGAAEQALCVDACRNENARLAMPGPTRTFAVGIGPFAFNDGAYDPRFLGALAVAGGTRASATCDPDAVADLSRVCHFQLTPGAQTLPTLTGAFRAAIDSIRARANGCEFRLIPSAEFDPQRVNVYASVGKGPETLVHQDPLNGWTYDDPVDPARVLLHGESCERATSLDAHVRVVLGCKTEDLR